MMDVAAGSRKPRNMAVPIANLAAALVEVAEEYDTGGLGSDDWYRIRSARLSIESAIEALRHFSGDTILGEPSAS